MGPAGARHVGHGDDDEHQGEPRRELEPQPLCVGEELPRSDPRELEQRGKSTPQGQAGDAGQRGELQRGAGETPGGAGGEGSMRPRRCFKASPPHAERGALRARPPAWVSVAVSAPMMAAPASGTTSAMTSSSESSAAPNSWLASSLGRGRRAPWPMGHAPHGPRQQQGQDHQHPAEAQGHPELRAHRDHALATGLLQAARGGFLGAVLAHLMPPAADPGRLRARPAGVRRRPERYAPSLRDRAGSAPS